MSITYAKFTVALATLALVGAGCAVTQPSTSGISDSKKESGALAPEAASEIVLKDCKATPKIYQAKEGSTMAFKNQDAVAHTILMDSNAYSVAANGKLDVAARFSLPAPTTINYLCDNTSNGDAIFVTP